jgi:NAD(P)-dependent dehydrogenase (short-subunit alcohol dehydrogenase family)
MGRLNGKTAIVSGAARGIGARTAMALAAEGANVVVTDRLADVGEATVKEIADAGGSAAFMSHDVTSEEEWARVVDDTVARFGGLQVLVNNAGVFLERTIEEMTVEEWRRLSAVNLEGVFLGTKHGVRAMKACCPPGGPSGSIVNLSSIAGMVGSPWSSAYSMSKGGVRLFTKSAALEFAQLGYNVRVNSVHPGIINTDMMHEVAHKWQTINKKNDFDAAWTALSKRQPIGRMGVPDEIARGIVFLASDESSLMNGAELVLDGGITAE